MGDEGVIGLTEPPFAFLSTGNRGERLFDSRYTPAVADAIQSAHPVERHLAGYTLHLPAAAN